MKVQKNTIPHYLVNVAGTYATRDVEGEKKKQSYNFVIPVPVSVTAMIPVKRFDPLRQTHTWEEVQKTLHINDFGILSYLLKESRIQNKIRKNDPGFIVVLTHEIIDIKTSSPEVQLPSNPHVLNKQQLTKFIKSNGWPIDISLFSTLKELREAVINYKESPECYELFETNKRRRVASGNAFTEEQEKLEMLYEGKDNGPQEPSNEEPVI